MIILCADDYALTEGVSRAIGELAAAQRLSATSVLVTSPHWTAMAPRLSVHRGRLSVGLHLNMTLGAPLGPMPRLASAGSFPGLRGLIVRAALGLLDVAEIRVEIERQLDCFERELRAPPDHVDGHQHVHVLPGIRSALLGVLRRRYPNEPPLVRDPSDRPGSIRERNLAVRKALIVSGLAIGFNAAAHRAKVPVNDTFSGYSTFDAAIPYADELRQSFSLAGRRHIVMCHPGHPDAELAALDPVVERRGVEYDTLMRHPDLQQRIWRPARRADGPPIAWSELRD